MHNILIIGGGAAGMMAAIFAARTGGNVTLLERKPQPEGMVPYARWADAQGEADRLKVEVDLLKMALEDARSMQPAE